MSLFTSVRLSRSISRRGSMSVQGSVPRDAPADIVVARRAFADIGPEQAPNQAAGGRIRADVQQLDLVRRARHWNRVLEIIGERPAVSPQPDVHTLRAPVADFPVGKMAPRRPDRLELVAARRDRGADAARLGQLDDGRVERGRRAPGQWRQNDLLRGESRGAGVGRRWRGRSSIPRTKAPMREFRLSGRTSLLRGPLSPGPASPSSSSSFLLR